MPQKTYPHILVLMSDEHRPDILGAEGDAVVRTPHLDELARKGTYFRNAYCTSPVCVPSRQSFLAGKLPRTIDVLKFGDPFDSNILTFPGQLARYGYNTTAFGKMHFEDVDQMHGWLERPSGDIHVRLKTPQAPDVWKPEIYLDENIESGALIVRIVNAEDDYIGAAKAKETLWDRNLRK